MKTIAEQWEEFAGMVLPRNAGDVQRIEMRKAFFAGFHAALCSVSDASGLPDKEAFAELDKLRAEGLAYLSDLMKGRLDS